MVIAGKSWKELNPYNEILFSLEKEEKSDLWINLEDIRLSEVKSDRKR